MLDYKKTMALGRRLLDQHGLRDWSFDVENLRNHMLFGPQALTAGYARGVCCFFRKHIALYWGIPQRCARQVILHEVAHALVGGQAGHGRRFLAKALEISVTVPYLLGYTRPFDRRARVTMQELEDMSLKACVWTAPIAGGDSIQ